MSLESPDIFCYIGYDPSGRSANFAQDDSETLAVQLQCSENGGDSTTGDDTTTQILQPDRGKASEGIGSNDTTTGTTSDNQPQVKAGEEGPQELNQEGTLLDQNEQQVTAKEATPVALRTRTRVTVQQATSKRIDYSKEKSGQDTKRCKDKELIQHFTRQVKEQRDIINEMDSAIERFLRIQPVLKKIQGNIDKAKLAMTQEKFKVQIPDRDQPIEQFRALVTMQRRFPSHVIRSRQRYKSKRAIKA